MTVAHIPNVGFGARPKAAPIRLPPRTGIVTCAKHGGWWWLEHRDGADRTMFTDGCAAINVERNARACHPEARIAVEARDV